MAIPFSTRRHPALQVLAGTLFVGTLVATCALASIHPARAQNLANNEDTVAHEWENARVSLQLKQVPLSQMLWLLGAQSAVRFRYATVPDAQTTIELKDAQLRLALRDVLATQGFRVQPSALGRIPYTPPTLWIAREDRPQTRPIKSDVPAFSTARPPVAPPVTTWQMWTKGAAPDTNWMRPPLPSLGAFSGTVGPNGQTLKFDKDQARPAPQVPGLDPVGVQVKWSGVGAREEKGWATLDFALDETPARPGVQMVWPKNMENSALPVDELRLRWPLELRRVPSHVQLWLETDRPAAFYVNGARVLSWTGARRLDLSSALQHGVNLLAIVWTPQTAAEKKEAAASAPQLRYEWLVGE